MFDRVDGILYPPKKTPEVYFSGVTDAAGMYDMMTKRPSDAIYGCVGENGSYLWGKNFPEGRCFYPP